MERIGGKQWFNVTLEERKTKTGVGVDPSA